jgi:hypothetical protein
VIFRVSLTGGMQLLYKRPMSLPTVAVQVPQLGDDRHKHWAKVVSGVDTSRSSGWAFEGSFVADGGIQDLVPGSLLLVYGERGNRANPTPEAALFTVNADATLSPEAEAKGRAWARTLRDKAQELLEGAAAPAFDLSPWPDEVLADELIRRGWRVVPPD